MPTLWKADPSPPANCVRALADILGVSLDLVDVDVANSEHKSEKYKKINPLGTFPVLKDGDFILTDSHAINKYLLEKYGTAEQKAALYPTDLETRAIIDQALFFDAGVLFIRLRSIALPTRFEGLTGLTAKHLQDIEEAYAVLEAYISPAGYLAGGNLTLADLSVGVTTAALHRFVELDANKFPKASAWLSRLRQVPSIKKCCEPGFDLLHLVMTTTWEANKQKQSGN